MRASTRDERMDRGILGALRQGKAGQVLSPHGARPETALCRAVEMGGVHPRDGTDPGSIRPGGIMSAFFRKVRWLTERDRKEAELREELQFHLEEEAEERQALGLAEDQARWAARRELGSIALVLEDTRATWGWTTLEQVGQDLRYAFRTMGANRLFTTLVVLCLALGIGANTAIYSFMDSILLRALPVTDPESLVVLNWHAKPRNVDDGNGGARRDFVMK